MRQTWTAEWTGTSARFSSLFSQIKFSASKRYTQMNYNAALKLSHDTRTRLDIGRSLSILLRHRSNQRGGISAKRSLRCQRRKARPYESDQNMRVRILGNVESEKNARDEKEKNWQGLLMMVFRSFFRVSPLVSRTLYIQYWLHNFWDFLYMVYVYILILKTSFIIL